MQRMASLLSLRPAAGSPGLLMRVILSEVKDLRCAMLRRFFAALGNDETQP